MADISSYIETLEEASRGEDVRDALVDALEAINEEAEDAGEAAEGAEMTANKVTSISGSSTNTEYPSAAAVWTLFNSLQSANGQSF